MSGQAPVDPVAASALHKACFEPRGERGWSAEEFAALLASPAIMARTLSQGGRLLGLIIVQKSHDEAEIVTICVDSAARRHGIGRRLVEECFFDLRNCGFGTVFLEVAVDNHEARDFYFTLGFEECGVRENYYARKGGNKVSAQVLRISLHKNTGVI